MKKNILRMVSLLLVLCLLAGCGAPQTVQTTPKTEPVPEETLSSQVNQGELQTPQTEASEATESTASTEETLPILDGGEDASYLSPEALNYVYTDVVANDYDPVRYVMIYNPSVYSEDSYYNPSLVTGSIGSQITVDLNRGGLEDLPENMTMSQDELNDGIPFEEFDGEPDRVGALAPIYYVGDTKVFYCADQYDMDAPRITREFTCRYAGQYCNIWVSGVNLSDDVVNKYGQEFDSYVYPNVVNTFGTARFTDNGGKVNLLYYPLREYLGGFFSSWDLYATGEVRPNQITKYGLNTDHAILHINGNYADSSLYPGWELFMRSVTAHEFQHLICATAAFETPDFQFCDSWFNEAMSGYIEETLFPTVKETSSGHMSAFRYSNLIRNGQSLYNFTSSGRDIGVYGSVYLYADYLTKLSGSDVFSSFHNIWRYSYEKGQTTPKVLMTSISLDAFNTVLQMKYPPELRFVNWQEMMMSKLTLMFYMDLLHRDAGDPDSFYQVDPRDLLYDQTSPAYIEGGGRIIVELEGDEFVIPQDADDGLIYVGLNADFRPVTGLICG